MNPERTQPGQVALEACYLRPLLAKPTIECNDGVGACRAGDVVVLMWNAPIDGARMDWALQRLVRWIDDAGGSAVVLNIVLSTASPPDGAARRAFMRLPHSRNRVRCFVTFAGGDGFWLSLVRSVVRGLAISTGQAGRFTVCGTLGAALDVVAHSAGPATPRGSELRAALAELGLAVGTGAFADARAETLLS
jgi:hypothetical protein